MTLVFKKIAIAIVVLASIGLNGYFIVSKNREMTVATVHDGDTFTLGDGQRVRLLGVDAPEVGKCGSEEAKELLTSLVLGKIIRIREEKRDAYGRRMGLVWTGNTMVNEIMLKSGWSKPNYDPNSKSDDLKNAFHYANDNKLGVFSKCKLKASATPLNPKCAIKGNVDPTSWEHYYHLPSCRHYYQIVLDTDMGKGFFCSEKEAVEAGFHLAPDCLS